MGLPVNDDSADTTSVGLDDSDLEQCLGVLERMLGTLYSHPEQEVYHLERQLLDLLRLTGEG